MGKYKEDFFGIKKIIFCFINLLMFISCSFLFYYLPIYSNSIKASFKKKLIIILGKFIIGGYDAFFRVLQSIFIIFFFTQINYNKYIGKIISFFGPLTFGIYLIHDNNLVRKNLIKKYL